MHHFSYLGSTLHCEDVNLAAVAGCHGTPTYVYSVATIVDNVTRLQNCMPGLDMQICYAMKANSSLALLRLFANLGTGFDLVSGGEIQRVLAAGGEVKSSVFAGVGKTEAEIELALRHAVSAFHVESEPELARINQVAGRLGLMAPVAIRLNPHVDARTHAKITTGKSDNKFGIPLAAATAAYETAARLAHVRVAGVQMHIGSQLTSIGPFREAVAKVVPFVAQLQKEHALEYFSIGGGIGIMYEDALASGQQSWWNDFAAEERPITPEAYGAVLEPLLSPLGIKVLLEPGRFLVGNAGILLSRVEYLKRGANRNFLVIDAAMNDLVRPAMYEGHHEIVPVERDRARMAMVADVVGPICETGDCFAQDREMPTVREGELVAFMSAGAYGFTMASRYNSRPHPAEVLVQGGSCELINRRETFETMVAGEVIPAFLT